MNERQITDMFECIIVWLTNIPLFPILTVICLIGSLIGIFFIVKPASAIEIQRRFYARINWKIEPISMPKEIRNTRIMGGVLVVLLVITLIFILIKPVLQ